MISKENGLWLLKLKTFQKIKAPLDLKDVGQGIDCGLIFRIKKFRSGNYLGGEIVPEELIFDLGLEGNLRHQSNIGKDR